MLRGAWNNHKFFSIIVIDFIFLCSQLRNRIGVYEQFVGVGTSTLLLICEELGPPFSLERGMDASSEGMKCIEKCTESAFLLWSCSHESIFFYLYLTRLVNKYVFRQGRGTKRKNGSTKGVTFCTDYINQSLFIFYTMFFLNHFWSYFSNKADSVFNTAIFFSFENLEKQKKVSSHQYGELWETSQE